MKNLSVLDHKLAFPEGYFRSKFFISANSFNIYVAAASPIFSILERLNLANEIKSFDSIYDSISHELQAFLSQISSTDDYQTHGAVAYFLLSATTDEILGRSVVKASSPKNKPFKAFTVLGKDKLQPEKKFFEILDYIKQYPESYINLLELAYYCLIMGYEGTFHNSENGRFKLDNLTEEIYQLINTHRVNEPTSLFNEQNSNFVSKKYKYNLFKKYIIISLFTAALIYLCDYKVLKSSINSIELEHQYTLAMDD